jgi:flagellar hook-associated protein 3 FlgL
MRITSSMSQRHLLSDLQRVQQRLSDAQNQVSSGKRVAKPSDDPLAAARATRLQADLDATAAYSDSVDEAKSWLDASDSALSSLNDVVQRVRELTVQAANGATSDAGRQAIKAEVDQLIKQAKTTLNQAYDGRYLFSGTKTDTPPYDVNTTPPDDTYKGDAGAILRTIGPGVTVQVNAAASGSTPPTDVLGTLLPALRTLSQDLQSNNISALGTTDLKAIDAGLGTVTAARSQIGAITNRVTAAKQRLNDFSDVTEVLLSNTQDADLPKSLTDLAMQQNALQSALQAGSTLIQQSLMDFLQ